MYNYPYFRQMHDGMPGGHSSPLMFPSPSDGMPGGSTMNAMPGSMQNPATGTVPGTGTTASPGPQPMTLQNTSYLPAYLTKYIGRNVRVQFLIGTTGPLVDRIGTLLGVGANYILMRPQDSDDILLADLYSIKFVDIYG